MRESDSRLDVAVAAASASAGVVYGGGNFTQSKGRNVRLFWVFDYFGFLIIQILEFVLLFYL